MRRETTVWAGLLLAAALALPSAAGASDYWDLASDDDDDGHTGNQLFHGSAQVHDLGLIFPDAVPDQDWYLLESRAFSSYQAVVDGMTGDLDLGDSSLVRMDATGVQVLTASVRSPAGGVLALDWVQGEAASPVLNYVRIRGSACGASCVDWDSYRIRFYETTYTVPRFNNSGTQATTLLVQNATDRTCNVTYYFLAANGGLITTAGGPLTPRELKVVQTALAAPAQSGSIRIAHTCGYGGLSGKAVAVESATGFTFDTPLVERPH